MQHGKQPDLKKSVEICRIKNILVIEGLEFEAKICNLGRTTCSENVVTKRPDSTTPNSSPSISIQSHNLKLKLKC